MTKIRSTDAKAAMLRLVAARREQGQEWVPADDLLRSGREYDQARTVAALVSAGMLERSSDGSVYAYRATPAGIQWVSKDQELDSLGRRRGGPRSAVPPEDIARARQLLAERGPDGKRVYKMQEVAEMVSLSRHTLSMYLNPERHKRRLRQRRQNYKNRGQQS